MEIEEDSQEVPQESDTIKKTARRVLNVTRWVWLCDEFNLSQKIILIFLSHQVKIKTYATRELDNSDIAKATGLHSKTVGLHLKWLIESEFIEEVKPKQYKFIGYKKSDPRKFNDVIAIRLLNLTRAMFRYQTAIAEEEQKGFRTKELLIMLAIIDHVGEDKEEPDWYSCFIKYKTIMAKTGTSRNSISESLRCLSRHKMDEIPFIYWSPKNTKKGHPSVNEYYIPKVLEKYHLSWL